MMKNEKEFSGLKEINEAFAKGFKDFEALGEESLSQISGGNPDTQAPSPDRAPSKAFDKYQEIGNLT